jgi:hypothetical protein
MIKHAPNNGGELRLGAPGSILFWEKFMGHLTLREALASHRLDDFVQEQQDDGAELTMGSELERGLALLITERRSLASGGQLGHQAKPCSDQSRVT